MTRRQRAARTLAAIAIIVLVAGGESAPAAAHGGTGSDATNFSTVVLDPGDDQLEWNVYGGDALIELVNQGDDVITVEGYQEEPYLQFVPGDGVYENTRSPTAYLNEDRYGTAEVPATADPDATPVWRRVGDGNRRTWHDHRAHWMAPDLPPAVDTEPDREHLVLSWTIPVRVGNPATGRLVEAAGQLRWIPGSDWRLPILVTGLTFLAVTFTAVVATRPRGPRWPGLARTATAIVWLVMAANAVRAVDDVLASPATPAAEAVLLISAATVLTIVGALTIAGWRGYPSGFLALGAAGVLTMLLFGTGSTDQLSASQLVTTLPNDIRRYTVAASYLIVIPTLGAALAAITRHTRYVNRNRPIAGPQWSSDDSDRQPEPSFTDGVIPSSPSKPSRGSDRRPGAGAL